MGCLLGGSVVALTATSSERTYATHRASQVCCSQSPCPDGSHCWPVSLQERLKHSKAGLPQSPLVVAAPFPGSWCTHVLFAPFKHLWQVWGLILNTTRPSCWDFFLALGCGVSFSVRSYIFLSVVDQQLAQILVFTQEKMSTCPSTPPSCH